MPDDMASLVQMQARDASTTTSARYCLRAVYPPASLPRVFGTATARHAYSRWILLVPRLQVIDATSVMAVLCDGLKGSAPGQPLQHKADHWLPRPAIAPRSRSAIPTAEPDPRFLVQVAEQCVYAHPLPAGPDRLVRHHRDEAAHPRLFQQIASQPQWEKLTTCPGTL